MSIAMTTLHHHPVTRLLAGALLAGVLAACGGGGDGPAIQARSQTLTFVVAPVLPLGGSASVSASASSGLTVSYRSDTPFICTVDATTGLVSALTPGNCIVAADQFGDSTFAPARRTQTLPVYVNPAQTIGFAAAPTLGLFSSATVSATASSALPVNYSSLSPAVCTVDSSTGLVTSLTLGSCIIAADQPGDSTYNAAPRATQTIAVAVPPGMTVPGVPASVTATLGNSVAEVRVSIGMVDAGGSPITGFTVMSSPAGVVASGAASPVTVTCPSSCNGYAFTVSASNAVGTGPSSAAVDVVTVYDVVETFREPATQPNDTIFTGSFTFNSTTGVVSALAGNLTQSMTGGCTSLAGCPGSYGSVPMTLVPLRHQLRSQPVVLGGVAGLLVTSFALTTTNTFFTTAGSDGWSPSVGVDVGGVYFGFPTAPNPASGGVGNAYAMVFINTADPTTPLTQAQINRLAYADCTSGGMMGAVCMTGTAAAGYTGSGVGTVGTMGGFPFSQVITRRP
jgi:hypothetical protein